MEISLEKSQIKMAKNVKDAMMKISWKLQNKGKINRGKDIEGG